MIHLDSSSYYGNNSAKTPQVLNKLKWAESNGHWRHHIKFCSSGLWNAGGSLNCAVKKLSLYPQHAAECAGMLREPCWAACCRLVRTALVSSSGDSSWSLFVPRHYDNKTLNNFQWLWWTLHQKLNSIKDDTTWASVRKSRNYDRVDSLSARCDMLHLLPLTGLKKELWQSWLPSNAVWKSCAKG